MFTINRKGSQMNHRFLACAAVVVCAGIASGQFIETGYVDDSVSIGQTFVATTSTSTPPDVNGAVGPDHYVEMLNNSTTATVNIFDKDSGLAVSQRTLKKFWEDAGIDPAVVSLTPFDPRVIYDDDADRWFAVAASARTTANFVLLAVSSGSDPTMNWTGFAIPTRINQGDGWYADFPTIGVSPDWVYVAHLNIGNGIGDTSALVVPKSDLLAATPTVVNLTRFEDGLLKTIYGTQVQAVFDQSPGSLDGSFVGVRSDYRHLPLSSSGGTPVLGTSTALTPSVVIQTPERAWQPVDSTIEVEPVPGISSGCIFAPLDAVLVSFFSRVVRQDGVIWGVHCARNQPLDRRNAIRWVKIDDTTSPPTILDEGVITEPSVTVMHPSIAINEFGDIVICYNTVGRSTTTGANVPCSVKAVVGRDVSGTVSFGSPILIHEGTRPYGVIVTNVNATLNASGGVSYQYAGNPMRWGDYSSASLDPERARTFWIHHMVPTDEPQGTVQCNGPLSYLAYDTHIAEVIVCIPDVNTQGASMGDPDYGQPDGNITAADINYFVPLWNAKDPAADLTTANKPIGDPLYGVPDGAVTGIDLQYYVNLYTAGCP